MVQARSAESRRILATEVFVGDEISYGLQRMRVDSIERLDDRIVFRGQVSRRGSMVDVKEVVHLDDLVTTMPVSDVRPEQGQPCTKT